MIKIRSSEIVIDSRKASKGSTFIAIRGSQSDGHDYIDDAITKGATTIVLEDKEKINQLNYKNINFVLVENSKSSLYELLRQKYSLPENIVAVTGTNGKTSVVNFVVQILDKLNVNTASIGTIGISDNKDLLKRLGDLVNLTTPDPVTLYYALDAIKKANIDNVALEASSHGLEQGRLGNINIKAAAFTSFSQDHLDYHETMEEYFKAKMILFQEVLPEGADAILNSDIEEFYAIEEICSGRNQRILSYGKKGGFIKINSISYDNGVCAEYEVLGKKYEIRTKLLGDFQLYNLFAAAALVYSLGFDYNKISEILGEVKSIRGRMERVYNSEIFVDYAHTPDALEKALSEMKKNLEGKLFVVFGCGGDRDETKRPLMGMAAAKFADKIIVTDDNPRTENPEKIRKEIMSVIHDAMEISPREKAIEYAIDAMQSGDRLLIAGKGHEDYQIIGNTKHHLDDVEIVKQKLSS